jgi:integrase
LGFVEYVKETASGPDALVFPLLRPGGPDRKLGYNFTKWFSKYRRDIGLYEKGVDYHSFRHGVTTKLYEAGVQEALIDELTGHEGQGTSRRVYKKQMPLRVLLEAISKVEWSEMALIPVGRPPDAGDDEGAPTMAAG